MFLSETYQPIDNNKLVNTRAQPVTKSRVAEPRFDANELYELAEKFGTPYYLIDESVLRKKVSEIEHAFTEFKGAFRVAYSIKANFNPSVIKTFVSEGIMFDLTSTGELYFLIRCGGNPQNVMYTSITETYSEFETILRAGVKHVVVASFNGLQNLIEAAGKTNTEVNVMIRINPEVRVHAELRGSIRHGKFGLQLDGDEKDSAFSVLSRILSTPGLRFEGFHFHLGSQIEDPTCYAEAIEKLEVFILNSRKILGNFPVNTIDIGGGMPVSYGKHVPAPSDFASRIVPHLNSLIESIGSRFTLIAESGRYLTAESTVLVSRIVNTKKFGENKYVYIDAGYHLLIDSALLRHEYPVEVIPDRKNAEQKTVLVGRLCDPLDVFPTSSRSKLGGAEPGKLVVFRDVGAYSIVMNMPFHSVPRPWIILRDMNGKYVVARKAQTIEDLFLQEGGDLLPS
jgi:diaminopimelate decarboxylase